MRTLAALITLAALASASRADVLFDSTGFDGYAPGNVAGQHGWNATVLNPGQPNRPVTIAETTPLGHGRALQFDDVTNTESAAEVSFGVNLVGRYRYVSVQFSMLRDGDGLLNNLLWYGTGVASTPWYGMAWDNGGTTPAQFLPAGFAAPGIQQTPGRWTSIRLDYDLADGVVDEYVNGDPLSRGVTVGADSAFTGWAFADQYDGTNNALGQRAFIDDFSVIADNSPIVPEPGTLALLCGSLPFCLALRRRKA